MRPKTKERTMRLLLASLLESDMSKRELNEVANNISGQEFLWEFGEMLRETVAHLENHEMAKQLSFPSENLGEVAYEIVQRRRIPKRDVLDYLRIVSSEKRWRMADVNAPMREIFKEFFQLASRDEADKLLSMLQGGRNVDAYLKGISRKG